MNKSSNKSQLSQKIIDKVTHWLQKQCPILIFFPTIDLMNSYLILFQQQFKYVLAVHSKDIKRHEKISLFKQRKVSILLTTTILERGITYHNLCVAVIASEHHQFSEAALIQIAGRVDRKINNQYGEIIFYHQKISLTMIMCHYQINKMNKLAKKREINNAM